MSNPTNKKQTSTLSKKSNITNWQKSKLAILDWAKMKRMDDVQIERKKVRKRKRKRDIK